MTTSPDEPKALRVSFVVTFEYPEVAAVRAQARAHGLTVSRYLRHLALTAAGGTDGE